MRIVIVCGSFVASLLAFLVTFGAGVFLAAISQSGERGAGVLLILVAVLAFGSALFLVFAPATSFGGSSRKTIAMAATFAALVPVAVLAWAALLFAGLPFGSRAPLMDWSVFAVGLMFALGAFCILALGYRRATERPASAKPRGPYDREFADEEIAADEAKVTRV